MYGSSESQRFFTSTSPSRSGASGTLSVRKLSSLTQPDGRLARSTRLFSIGAGSLTGTALAGEQAGLALHDQHFAAGLRLEAPVDRDERRRKLLLGQFLLQALAGTRFADRPRESRAAFAECGAVIAAEHAERTAQHLHLFLAAQVSARRTGKRIKRVGRQQCIAARLIAAAFEQQSARVLAVAPEVVELGDNKPLTHEVRAVWPQGEREREAAVAAWRVGEGRRQLRERRRRRRRFLPDLASGLSGTCCDEYEK